MKTKIINNKIVAIIESDKILLDEVQKSLDYIMTIKYETKCECIIINKEAISEDFFDLKTKFAGEILQKFINYHLKLVIIGDFTVYNSKALKDFIYESNNGKDIFFLSSRKEALEKLQTVL